MPTSQAPTLLSILNDIEAQLEAAADTTDIQELRAILRRPTRVAVSERTYLLTVLAAVAEQLDVVRNLRAGALDSLRQARPEPPGPPTPGE